MSGRFALRWDTEQNAVRAREGRVREQNGTMHLGREPTTAARHWVLGEKEKPTAGHRAPVWSEPPGTSWVPQGPRNHQTRGLAGVLP